MKSIFIVLILLVCGSAHGEESIYVNILKGKTIRLSGPAFKELWKTRGASENEIEARLMKMADTLANCHEEQFRLFGPKYYNMVVHELEKGANFDKAFESSVDTIMKDINNGALPGDMKQQLKSFYLNVGLCQNEKLSTDQSKHNKQRNTDSGAKAPPPVR